MERIKKKIQSQSGASFLFALLAFLVAAMVSVTIVSAAVTNVKRIHDDRESQQAQLTLISAARLVRDEMEKTRYIITTVTTETAGSEPVSTRPTPTLKGTFAAEMQAAVEYVNAFNNPYELKDAFEINATNVDGFKMAPVKVSFDMKAGEKKYNLVFKFSIAETGETLFLGMTGQRKVDSPPPEPITDEEGNIIGTITTVTETYIWSQGIINGIGDTNEAET